MANVTEDKFHCDMWYFDNVCPSRGKEDIADIRIDREGWLRQSRSFCTTRGLCPMTDYKLCPHCIEHKHWFRAEPRVLTGQLVMVTPFLAKTDDAKTVKAYRTRESLKKFLGDKSNLYGVNYDTGRII